MPRVMLDIETLGTSPGSVVTSIGATYFDGNGIYDPFHERISIGSCLEAGLTMDADTVEWWQDQDEEARWELCGRRDLVSVLAEFTNYLEDAGEIWANSHSFDCSILSAAYDAVDMERPWSYHQERCFRTLKNLPGAITEPPDGFESGTQHNALDDAEWQGVVASRNLERLQ